MDLQDWAAPLLNVAIPLIIKPASSGCPVSIPTSSTRSGTVNPWYQRETSICFSMENSHCYAEYCSRVSCNVRSWIIKGVKCLTISLAAFPYYFTGIATNCNYFHLLLWILNQWDYTDEYNCQKFYCNMLFYAPRQ